VSVTASSTPISTCGHLAKRSSCFALIIPKLQEELVHAHEHGIGYQLVQADFALDYPDLQLPMGSNDLVLTPVVDW
jgi:hypothetical protein